MLEEFAVELDTRLGAKPRARQSGARARGNLTRAGDRRARCSPGMGTARGLFADQIEAAIFTLNSRNWASALEGPDEQGLRLPRIGVRLFQDIERLA